MTTFLLPSIFSYTEKIFRTRSLPSNGDAQQVQKSFQREFRYNAHKAGIKEKVLEYILCASRVQMQVDQKEWAKDEAARDQLSSRATRLENITQQISDTNRVIGFDIYQTCLSVYQNCKFLSAQNMPRAKALYEKWSAPFSGRRSKALKADKLTNTETN